MSLGKIINRGSPGGTKIWVTLIIAVLAVAILVGAKVGPVLGAKYDLEDYLKAEMNRIPIHGEEVVFEEINEYVTRKKIPIKTWEDCRFESEEDCGAPAVLYCKYRVKLNFYDAYTWNMPVHAEHKSSKLPCP